MDKRSFDKYSKGTEAPLDLSEYLHNAPKPEAVDYLKLFIQNGGSRQFAANLCLANAIHLALKL